MATRDSFPDRWPVGGSHLSPDERRTRTSYFLGRNRVVSSRIKAGKSVVLNQPFTAPLHRGFLALARFSSQPRFLLPLDLLVQVLCARLGGALLTMSRAIFVRFICEYDLTSFNAGTSAVPSPVTTRRTSTLPFSVAPGRNTATPHTRHIASAVQRKTRRSVAFHNPRKCNPTMNPLAGNKNCDRANCLSNQIDPKIAATSNATANP